MSERDDLAAALRRCVPDGTWLEAATRLLASDWLAAHDADVRRAPVVDQPEHTVAWQDKANIICGCGQVFSHDYGKSPAPILGSTSDYYLRTHCGTLYARHLRDVRTTNAADVRRAERERVAEDNDAALESLYDEHMADAVAHRGIAERHKREGNTRKAEAHMNTAHAFRNVAAGVAEARVRIAREVGESDG